MTDTTIELTFTAGWSIDLADILDELDIKRRDIEEMHIKYCTIHITTKDGRELEYETCAYEAEIDTKRPAEIYLFEGSTCVASSYPHSGTIPLEPEKNYMYVLMHKGEPIFASTRKYECEDKQRDYPSESTTIAKVETPHL